MPGEYIVLTYLNTISRFLRLPGHSVVKNCLPLPEKRVQSLGWEDHLEEEMATHSSILAWRIPWRRSLVGYSPRCRKQSDMTEQLNSLLVNISKYLCIFSFSGNLSVIFVFWVYFGSDCYSYESNVFFFSCLMLLIFTFLLSSQILLL